MIRNLFSIDRSSRKGATFSRWLGVAGLVLSLALLAHLFRDANVDLVSLLDGIGPSALALATLVALLSVGVNTLYNERLLAGLQRRGSFSMHVAGAFVISLAARYLPGRVWGMVVQGWTLRDSIPPTVIVASGMLQFLATNASVLLVSASVLVWFSFGALPAALLAVGGWCLSELIHRRYGTMFRVLTLRFRLFDPLADAGPVPTGTTLLGLDWILRCLLWVVILPASVGWSVALSAAVIYALASSVASLVAIVPAGIAIREAVYISLGARLGFSIEDLFAQAAIARVVLTVAEAVAIAAVTLVGIAWGTRRRTELS